MSDKIELAIGDWVILAGPPDGKPLPEQYQILRFGPTKDTLRLRTRKGVSLMMHKSRILNRVNDLADGNQEIAIVSKHEKPAREKEKRKMSTTAIAAKPAPEKAVKAVKAVKEIKELAKPFDLDAWVKEHGSVHLSKTGKFDHPTHKLICHACVDEKNGYYYTINTYEIDGVVTLGKNGKGGNQYALKGRKIHQKIKQKNGNTATRIIKGKRTAEEQIKKFEKDGYKRN